MLLISIKKKLGAYYFLVYLLLHVSGNCVPIIRRTYGIYATLVFFTLCGWLPGLQTSIFISNFLHVSGNYVPIIRGTYCIYATLSGLQTRQPPIRSEKYQCRIDTVSSPDDGHTVARNM